AVRPGADGSRRGGGNRGRRPGGPGRPSGRRPDRVAGGAAGGERGRSAPFADAVARRRPRVGGPAARRAPAGAHGPADGVPQSVLIALSGPFFGEASGRYPITSGPAVRRRVVGPGVAEAAP